MPRLRKCKHAQQGNQALREFPLSLEGRWHLSGSQTQAGVCRSRESHCPTAGLERYSLRGGERIFDSARQTVTRPIATPMQKLPEVKDLLLPASVDDGLELDEIWSVVLKKERPRWLWAALCRRTRHMGACGWVREVKRPVIGYGGPFPTDTSHARPAVVLILLIGTFCRKPPIMVSKKKLGRQRIESDGPLLSVSE
jgi:hypothetical protein